MFNLIRMDVYRMFHSISTWVILIFTAGLAVFFIMMTDMDLQAIADDQQYARQMEAEYEDNTDTQLGIYSDTNPQWVSGDIDAAELAGAKAVCSHCSALFLQPCSRARSRKTVTLRISQASCQTGECWHSPR